MLIYNGNDGNFQAVLNEYNQLFGMLTNDPPPRRSILVRAIPNLSARFVSIINTAANGDAQLHQWISNNVLSLQHDANTIQNLRAACGLPPDQNIANLVNNLLQPGINWKAIAWKSAWILGTAYGISKFTNFFKNAASGTASQAINPTAPHWVFPPLKP